MVVAGEEVTHCAIFTNELVIFTQSFLFGDRPNSHCAFVACPSVQVGVAADSYRLLYFCKSIHQNLELKACSL
jgi:hypothetical protein